MDDHKKQAIRARKGPARRLDELKQRLADKVIYILSTKTVLTNKQPARIRNNVRRRHGLTRLKRSRCTRRYWVRHEILDRGKSNHAIGDFKRRLN